MLLYVYQHIHKIIGNFNLNKLNIVLYFTVQVLKLDNRVTSQ
jgi:hypothetical protein